jgi:hypothetical protein
MTDAMSRQHGGTHYKSQAIQPIELSMANGYDACIHSAIKYISRHREKGGAEDLRKGDHFTEIRVELRKKNLAPIPIEDYIKANGIPEPEAAILRNLDAWARSNHGMSHAAAHSVISEQIRDLTHHAYLDGPAPKQPQPEDTDSFPDFTDGDL